jgi:putative hydrolase
MQNDKVAQKLREAASVLQAQGGEPFRARAYQRAADTLAGLSIDVATLLREEGTAGLERLPGIGKGIASAIAELVTTGRWSRLDRMRGELDPEALLQTVPGIGPELAARIHDTLHIDTLEGLEAAAYDGSLGSMTGIGPRRLYAIRAALDHMLRRRRAAHPLHDRVRPGVEILLDVDREYLERAARDELPRIAPRRFNPKKEQWLPILHTQRGDWHFTALFSNSALAHTQGRTHDWVVLYYYDGDHEEGQCTVVTEPRGPMAGHRVVRGREQECLASDSPLQEASA